MLFFICVTLYYLHYYSIPNGWNKGKLWKKFNFIFYLICDTQVTKSRRSPVESPGQSPRKARACSCGSASNRRARTWACAWTRSCSAAVACTIRQRTRSPRPIFITSITTTTIIIITISSTARPLRPTRWGRPWRRRWATSRPGPRWPPSPASSSRTRAPPGRVTIHPRRSILPEDPAGRTNRSRPVPLGRCRNGRTRNRRPITRTGFKRRWFLARRISGRSRLRAPRGRLRLVDRRAPRGQGQPSSGRRDLRIRKDRILKVRRGLAPFGRIMVRTRRDLVIMTRWTFRRRGRKTASMRASKRRTRRTRVFRIIIRGSRIRLRAGTIRWWLDYRGRSMPPARTRV